MHRRKEKVPHEHKQDLHVRGVSLPSLLNSEHVKVVLLPGISSIDAVVHALNQLANLILHELFSLILLPSYPLILLQKTSLLLKVLDVEGPDVREVVYD